ncbi:MAG: AraC family transcriptional regulator [Oscillospiraceae bacterium]
MQKRSILGIDGYKVIHDTTPFEEGTLFFPNHPRDYHSPDSKNVNYLHYHDDIEIGYCHTGSGVFFIENQIVPYQAPCVSIIYGGQLHIAQSSSTMPSYWSFININNKAIPGLFPDGEIFDCAGEVNIITQENDAYMLPLVETFLDELKQIDYRRVECAQSLVKAILIRHGRYCERNGSMKTTARIRRIINDIAPAVSYIANHYMEEINVDGLAKLCSFSPPTLRRKFEEAFSLSPLDYLHKVRIHTAQWLLSLEDKSVLEVCHQVGYQSQSSFNRQFKKHTNTSPMKLRKVK